MIVGFISDAHGNELGLERTLVALRRMGAEKLYFLGDSVGYLPGELAVLRKLAEVDAHCIRGNHEEMLLGNLPVSESDESQYRLSGARERLDTAAMADFKAWPTSRELNLDGARLLLVHGHPFDFTTGYLYEDSDFEPLSALPYDFVFCGHTHRPFVKKAGPSTFVNVGSCGLPRDVGNLASGAIYDSVSRDVQVIRTTFDVERLIESHHHDIHDAVVACLRRRTADSPIGRLIDE
jgi:putative phosphoesterase